MSVWQAVGPWRGERVPPSATYIHGSAGATRRVPLRCSLAWRGHPWCWGWGATARRHRLASSSSPKQATPNAHIHAHAAPTAQQLSPALPPRGEHHTHVATTYTWSNRPALASGGASPGGPAQHRRTHGTTPGSCATVPATAAHARVQRTRSAHASARHAAAVPPFHRRPSCLTLGTCHPPSRGLPVCY